MFQSKTLYLTKILSCLKFNILAYLVFSILTFYLNNSFAARNRHSTVRSLGDYLQIINPLIAASFASQERGVGHFGIIYAQSLIITHGTKLIAKSGKWEISRRPHIENKKDRYEGMPSGHTVSAWSAASYIRTFSDDYKLFSIPLYISAAVTGYSRIKSKEHTTGQVLAGAALAEIVTMLNSKLTWNNEYKSTNFFIGPEGGAISFQFKF